MVGSQNGFRERISVVSQGRSTKYSRRDSHAYNRAASQTEPSDIRGEARRLSPRAAVLLRIRTLDAANDDSETALPMTQPPLSIMKRPRFEHFTSTRTKCYLFTAMRSERKTTSTC